MPIPVSDSSSTEVVDFAGALREITIEGRYVGTSLSNIKTNFVDVYNALLDGDQSSTISYVSDLHGTITVKLDEFLTDNDTETTGPLSVAYTMRLVESA